MSRWAFRGRLARDQTVTVIDGVGVSPSAYIDVGVGSVGVSETIGGVGVNVGMIGVGVNVTIG